MFHALTRHAALLLRIRRRSRIGEHASPVHYHRALRSPSADLQEPVAAVKLPSAPWPEPRTGHISVLTQRYLAFDHL